MQGKPFCTSATPAKVVSKIPEGAEATTCYLADAQRAPVTKRREWLRGAYGFECACERCAVRHDVFANTCSVQRTCVGHCVSSRRLSSRGWPWGGFQAACVCVSWRMHGLRVRASRTRTVPAVPVWPGRGAARRQGHHPCRGPRTRTCTCMRAPLGCRPQAEAAAPPEVAAAVEAAYELGVSEQVVGSLACRDQ
jgi:hypothetical protein